VALDDYAWCVDFDERAQYWASCAANGVLPDHNRDKTEFWHAESMPGRRSFDLARRVLASNVEPVMADFMTVDLDDLGVFDVVLYFGVLYHMLEPLTALRRLRHVTGRVAAIETAAVLVAGHEDASLLAFYPGNELNADYGNWFAPTEAALHGLCRAAGFGRVETRVGPPARARHISRAPDTGRRIRWLRYPVQDYRAVVHAFP
jgi:tRNA (mo5U34)-methyltransferase